MAHRELDYTKVPSTSESFKNCFNLRMGEAGPTDVVLVVEASSSSIGQSDKIPKPPPLPSKTFSRSKFTKRLWTSSYVPKDTKDAWDRIFMEGFQTDVQIFTEEQSILQAHSSVLSIASPVLRNLLKEAKVKNGIRYIKILGVPSKAVHAFIRFIYAACYEEDETKEYALHLLVLSHCYSVPSLKSICISKLEQGWLTTENAVDVLQLARQCDAPRLRLICVRMIVKDFKTLSATAGWKVMKRVDPSLEQELVESAVEADSKKQEKVKKIEEKKMYLQLNEAMDALLHICRDGCRTIGPKDKVLKGSHIPCGFSACKGLEMLVRHFSVCKTRVPGGCAHCKRMWQLLELHSRMCNEPDSCKVPVYRMCNEPDSCKVPLCRHFKDKVQNQTKKDEARWKLLVSKVKAAKIATPHLSACRSITI